MRRRLGKHVEQHKEKKDKEPTKKKERRVIVRLCEYRFHCRHRGRQYLAYRTGMTSFFSRHARFWTLEVSQTSPVLGETGWAGIWVAKRVGNIKTAEKDGRKAT